MQKLMFTPGYILAFRVAGVISIVVGGLLAADGVVDLAVTKDFLPHDPGPNRPAGERGAVPG